MIENAWLCAPMPFTVASVAQQTAAGPATNLTNDRLGRAWQFPAGGVGVFLDLGAQVAVDTIALLATNLGPGDIWRARVSTAATPDAAFFAGVVADSGLVPCLASPDGTMRVHRQALFTMPAPVTGRMVYIEVNSAAVGTIGRAVIGKRFQPVENIDFGWDYAIVDRGTTEVSALGVRDRLPLARVMEYKFAWGWQTEAEARGAGLDLQLYAGATRPVLLCIDSAAADRHNLIGYGELTGIARTAQFMVDGYSAAFVMSSDLVMGI